LGRRKHHSRDAALLQCTNQSMRAARFIMPHRSPECELAMTVILKFYDDSDVCRIS
jgi:hypothetical protein